MKRQFSILTYLSTEIVITSSIDQLSEVPPSGIYHYIDDTNNVFSIYFPDVPNVS